MPKGWIYIASWGKSTTGTILPSTNLLWLKVKLAKGTFNTSSLAKGKSSSSAFAPWDQDWSDWWFSKILRIRTGSDSILSDQDWTRTKKFYSPLISAEKQNTWKKTITGQKFRRDQKFRLTPGPKETFRILLESGLGLNPDYAECCWIWIGSRLQIAS